MASFAPTEYADQQNSKGLLNEMCIVKNLPVHYETTRHCVANMLAFKSIVAVGSLRIEGPLTRNKKSSEQLAAEEALKQWDRIEQESGGHLRLVGNLSAMSPGRTNGSPDSNYIGQLQDFLSQRGHPAPKYEDMGHTGPDHMKTFSVRVTVNGISHERSGKSKKEAKHNAAKAMIEEIRSTVSTSDRVFSTPKKPSTPIQQSPFVATMSPSQRSPLAGGMSPSQRSPLAASTSCHSPPAGTVTPHRQVATNLTDHPAFCSPHSVTMDSPSHSSAPRDEEAEMVAAAYEDLLRPFDRCVRSQGLNDERDEIEIQFLHLLTSSAESSLVSFVTDKAITAHFTAMGTATGNGTALCVLHLKPTKITTHGCGTDVESARYQALLSAMHYLATMKPWNNSASE